MLEALLCLALLPSAPPLIADDPAPLESRIVEVTVFGGSASVRRRASLPAGDAALLFAGLPPGLDPDSVRVRCTGGEVVGVEVRERFQAQVADVRVAALRTRIRDLERGLFVLRDERTVLEEMQQHVVRLLGQEEDDHRRDVREGRNDPAAWDANYEYLKGKLTTLIVELRELSWKGEVEELKLRDLQLELGRFESSGGVHVRDVLVDVVDVDGRAGTVEVEYVVGNAGWEPTYDLRAQKDLSAVELVYRAKVWQRSGEDWTDAEILLSTARPQLGAQGPEPAPIWLSLHDPRSQRGVAASSRRRGGAVPEDLAAIEDLSALDFESLADDLGAEAMFEVRRKTFAAVSNEGLSVRYRLPRPETIESRDQPTTVLVGRAPLAIAPEHYCLPAVDTTVWLRARATNSSPWVMLPGRAAVYFGADFLGHARIEAVQLEQEFLLHLGPDPGVVVTRTPLDQKREESGMFSSKQTLSGSWRIEVENHGAFTSLAGGAVDVIVHEILPKSTDERISVELDKASPDVQTGARWKKEREEKGALTWILRVPASGKRVIELTTEITFPDDMNLRRR